jgi:uncharacterized alkaline shock family protein YloU
MTPTGSSVRSADNMDAEHAGLAGPRGSTTIASHVVAKIVQRAAAEVPGVEGVEQSGFRRLISLIGRGEAEPHVDAQADVDSETAVVKLTISVRYPLPLRQMSEKVRHHVSARTEELTGLRLAEVDIVVAALPIAGSQPRRRVE